MDDELSEVCEIRLKALDHIRDYQNRVQSAYNKRVKAKSFSIGDLVSKLTLHIDKKSQRYRKWSPNWEGPFRVRQVTQGNSYYLNTLEGAEGDQAINGKYLKHYYTSVWEDVG